MLNKRYVIKTEIMVKKNISLTEAIEICKSTEVAESQMKELNPRTNEINEIKNQNTSKNNRIDKKCKFCGNKWHNFLKDCPAKQRKCNICNKIGHFSKVCRTNKLVKEITYTSEENPAEMQIEEETKFVLQIQGNQEKVMRNLEIIIPDSHSKTVAFQLDTGANCNVIGNKNLAEILNYKLKMKESNLKLRVFGGGVIKAIGRHILRIKRNEKIFEEEFEVVDINHGPLLSAETCEKLGLIKFCNAIKEIRDVKTETIVEEFKDIFEGIGLLEGEVDLEIIKKHKPVKQTPRRLPVAMKQDLEEELRNMEQMGIIKKEEHYTDWISNITMVKKEGKTRICLDPRELNKVLKDTKHQLPTLDEILAEIGEAKIFSTVDAKKGFWQLKLNEKSSKLTTFWTPFGKYRYLRLPFGISTAMEIFQKKMIELIQGLEGVFVMADDILIIGKGETEEEALKDHNDNLRKLFERI